MPSTPNACDFHRSQYSPFRNVDIDTDKAHQMATHAFSDAAEPKFLRPLSRGICDTILSAFDYSSTNGHHHHHHQRASMGSYTDDRLSYEFEKLSPEPARSSSPARQVQMVPIAPVYCRENGKDVGTCSTGSDGPGEEDNDEHLDISDKLLEDCASCTSVINGGEEDEMEITGYRRSRFRTIICWICIILSGGLLRLVMHWWRHWYLLATHSSCQLELAEKVLVREDYQGKHQMYYVRDVIILNWETIQEMKSSGKKLPNYLVMDHDVDAKNFHLSVHFSSGIVKNSDVVRFFSCKQLRYVWDTQSNRFTKLKGLDVDIPNSYLHQCNGLTSLEQYARRLVYGLNEITIPYKGVMTLLFLEVLNPFYVFQFFSVALWFAYNYYYYAVVIVIMSAFGITLSIMQTKKNQDALIKTVLSDDNAIVVYESGETEKMQTRYLVPGDVIEIPSSGCTMQCDAVLLSGNCILDESMLTGESVPVTKTPLPVKRDQIFDKKEHSRHTLFCGTKVIQTRYIGSEKVLAVVINTGNITAKGGLIRSILYPPPVDYKFEQDSYKFIGLLGLIACIGFIYTLVSKILRDIPPVKIAVESLDLITIVVPPALPAAMTVGRYYAQKRLERKNIYCISPRSLNVSGSVDCVCFDKTGTLTEDGLDMWGVVPKTATNQFQIPLRQIDRLPCDNFLFSMVSCHSITIMNDVLRGDPLDLKMFESTGWVLEDTNVQDENKYDLLFPTIIRQPRIRDQSTEDVKSIASLEGAQDLGKKRESFDDLLAGTNRYNDIGIVREFPFSSSLQRMSVLTRHLTDDHFNVYCKGSPEMIQTLCKPSSIPDTYFTQLEVYAQQGYRIIAMAYKTLDPKVTYMRAQRIARDKIECDLEFLGFVILENRLKTDTTAVIKDLMSANIRTVMVTGDNILTALSVAKDCGMIKKTQSVITVNVRPLPNEPEKYELYYNLTGAVTTATTNGITSNGVTPNGTCDLNSCMTNSNSVASIETVDTWTHRDVEAGVKPPLDEYDDNDDLKMFPDLPSNSYRFAMVGKTWSVIRDNFPDLLPRFLTRGTIYARMSPDQKQALIIELQELGYYVAMCGDGANDCGALKVAHTGISLSEAESSVASPFTSRSPTIACVPTVIKEGRAALVTSFGIFKYMAAYSMVQFISVMILYSIDSNLTDKQYLYIDLCLISVFAFFFGQTKSYAGALVKQAPLSSLISLTPLVSICLHLAVAVSFQVIGWFHLRHQPWFEPFNFTETTTDNDLACHENYTIFVISCFQYIILALVFSKGAPYRRTIFSNLPFCVSLIVNTVIVIYFTLYPSNGIADFMEIVLPPEFLFRCYMLMYFLANFAISLFIESVIVEWLLFKKCRHHCQRAETKRRKYLGIENDLRQDFAWPPLSYIQNDVGSLNNNDDGDEEKASPISYAEIGADDNFDAKAAENSVLNNFFDEPRGASPDDGDAAGESITLSDMGSESQYESAQNHTDDAQASEASSAAASDRISGASSNISDSKMYLIKKHLETNGGHLAMTNGGHVGES